MLSSCLHPIPKVGLSKSPILFQNEFWSVFYLMLKECYQIQFLLKLFMNAVLSHSFLSESCGIAPNRSF